MSTDLTNNGARKESTGIQSIEVGVPLLKALCDAGEPMPLSALAARLGMPRSKVHKYLVSFVRTGLVEQKPNNGYYDLGPSALELGLGAMRRLSVMEIAQDALDALREELNVTASMAIWANYGPSLVRWAEAPHVTSHSMRLGTVFPVLTSTFGRVFAAFLNRSLTQPLIEAELANPDSSAAHAGLHTMEDVERLLATVREHRISAVDSIVAPGYECLSAPVFDNSNRIVAAVAVAGRRGQIDISLNSDTAAALLRMADALSRRLGVQDTTLVNGHEHVGRGQEFSGIENK
ncbi:MAG: IclR family transcriptional regulator [Aquisalimonadaceae bacterium]